MNDSSLSTAPDPDDFRIRVAANRRERMRGRLLDAVLEIYQSGLPTTNVVIDDVIRTADVSRGTFYKYFDSLESAVAALGEQMASSMMEDFSRLFAHEPDPSIRAIGGAAMTLIRAWHDPRWAGFTCRVDYVDYLARSSTFDTLVRDALSEAKQVGLMQFVSLDVAVDLIVGMTIEARRRLMRDLPAPRDYIQEMLVCTFSGLGMEKQLLLDAVQITQSRFLSEAQNLRWWSSSRHQSFI